MARADDVINVAAHRLSTGTMEAVISAHPAVAECAVIGPVDELKGQVPWGVVVLKRGYESADLNAVRRVRPQARRGVIATLEPSSGGSAA
jgi:propionyl-CoA synthetase